MNKEQSIVSHFSEIANKMPSSLAIDFENKQMTYRELDEETNVLAHYLKNDLNVQRGDIVGVMLDRSEQMIIAILAIIKAGGAFLPLDHSYPNDRKLYILEDANVQLLITDSSCWLSLDGYRGQVFAIDLQSSSLDRNVTAVDTQLSGDDLAYVIYTSGSTGRPKGVMIEHKSVLNMGEQMSDRYGMVPTEKILQFASLSFDASVSEIFVAMHIGACLVLVRKEVIDEPQRLIRYMKEKSVSAVTLPPVYLNALDVSSLTFLRILITAGEAANVKNALLCASFCRYINAYGPTECAVCVSMYRVRDLTINYESIPIGAALKNIHVTLLSGKRECKTGEPGELCVGGVCLARGYLNRPELTAEKFIDNPLSPGERLYMTGDEVVMDEDGVMSFLGRKDRQVKLSGQRIELDEIERCIHLHTAVEAAAVKVVETNRDKALIAYVVLKAGATIKDIEGFLAKSLPPIMIPRRWITMDKFPLSVSGKIDYKVLPVPVEETTDKIVQDDQVHRKLISIWSNILGTTSIDATSDFFQLGGNSLKAIHMLSDIYDAFSVNVNLSEFYEKPTIAALALSLSGAVPGSDRTPDVTDDGEMFPLAPAQRRLWIINQLNPADTSHNMSSAFRLTGPLSVDALRRAFTALAERHEILRTSFVISNDEPFQKISKGTLDVLQLIDLTADVDPSQKAARICEAISNDPFDLSKLPLYRTAVLKISSDEHILVFVTHHIIFDGWSLNVLQNEIVGLYNAFLLEGTIDLPILSYQYKDYTKWKLNYDHSSDRSYWLANLASPLPTLSLPHDFQRPAIKSFKTKYIQARFERDLLAKLKKLALEESVSLYSLIVASIKSMFFFYTRQTDMVIGTPVAGRSKAAFHDLIGCFLNIVAIRSTIDENEIFVGLMKRVHRTVVRALEHQEYPFENLNSDLGLIRDKSRNPIFDVEIDLHNLEDRKSSLQGFTGINSIPYQVDGGGGKFDLDFIFDASDEFLLVLHYNSDLFRHDTAASFVVDLETVFHTIASISNITIADISRTLQMTKAGRKAAEDSTVKSRRMQQLRASS
jgi:amino acid adenylation domain-containing protein